MTSTKTIEALQEIRDAKRDQLDTLSPREAMIVEAQVETLDAWIVELEQGRSLEGLVAHQHEQDHEALFNAMTAIEATERLAAELRQMEGHDGV